MRSLISSSPRATASAELAKNFLEKGYDTLGNAEKAALRTRVLAELNLRPSLVLEIRGLNATQQQALAERILKDPRFINEANTSLESIINSQNFDEIALTNAQNAVEDTQLEQNEAVLDQLDIERRFTQVEGQLRKFSRNNDGSPRGDAAIDLDLLKESNANSVTNVQRYESEVAVNQQKLQILRQELEDAKSAPRTHAQIDGDISAREGELSRLRTEEAAETDPGQKTILQNQMQGVRSRLTNLRNESSRTPANQTESRKQRQITTDIQNTKRNK